MRWFKIRWVCVRLKKIEKKIKREEVSNRCIISSSLFYQIISGRMLGVNEDCVPIVHLYGWVNVFGADGGVGGSEHEQQPRLLNRELVDRGVALWTEHIIAQ